MGEAIIIVRQRDGKPCLIDFGIVKEVINVDGFGNPTSTIIAGTPAFMAQEQAAGKPVFASDLYSLGMTAIYLFTGKTPGYMINRLTGEVEWRQFAKDVSPEFARILDKATEPHFRDRYKTAQEMLNALQSRQHPSKSIIEQSTILQSPDSQQAKATAPKNYERAVSEKTPPPKTGSSKKPQIEPSHKNNVAVFQKPGNQAAISVSPPVITPAKPKVIQSKQEQDAKPTMGGFAKFVFTVIWFIFIYFGWSVGKFMGRGAGTSFLGFSTSLTTMGLIFGLVGALGFGVFLLFITDGMIDNEYLPSWGTLGEALLESLKLGIIGAILGALIGALFGGFKGAQIGLMIGYFLIGSAIFISEI